ncbi:M20/M25/M40 family metallo-hydrolase [Candidatus Nomurabacteria bacterium]|nr:M20/M25/M40 family metallo-hydrolase [Candidatus Nomurabacteria bacterium]
MLGHADTVFPAGTVGTEMFPRIEEGKLYGPGAFDMKGGVLSMAYAIKALSELGMFPDKQVVVIVNSDEESGSFFSRDEIIKQALKSKCVFCLEPAPAGNDAGGLKTERYGRSEYTIKIQGRSAHSGNNPHDAINPIIEMSKLTQDIADLENQYEGLISSIVYAHSGTAKTALIPGEAEMYLDIRFETYPVGERIHAHIMNMRPYNEQIKLEITGKIEKPPLMFDKRLFELAQNVGSEIGIEMRKVKVGGGSDGNFTSGAGVPTLDGMGMIGEYIHNNNEFIYIENIPARVTILARMIQEV